MELDDFKQALDDKRHQEILTLLSNTNTVNKGIVEIVDANTKTLEKFIEKLQEINKEVPADIIVEVNQDLVIRELAKLTQEFKTNLTELKNNLNSPVTLDVEELKPLLKKEEQKKNWVFDIKRDTQGFIETVTAR
jgi:divalent metal cation (Fe/Co/Zn/Cd) transporter